MANFCRKCGCTLAPTNKFCTKCGTPVVEIKQNNTAPIHNENVQQRLHNLKETTVNASAAVKEKSKAFFEGKIPLRYRNKKIYIIAAAMVVVTIIAVVALSKKPSQHFGSDYPQIADKASNNELSEEERTTIEDVHGYVSENTNISLADSDFIGKWEMSDVSKEELYAGELDEDFFDGDTIVISKDGKYQCGNVKGKLTRFWFEPGSKEKGAYKYTEKTKYNPYGLSDYGTLYCVFAEDNGSRYPISTTIDVEWENEKHTEATLDFASTSPGSMVQIKKK